MRTLVSSQRYFGLEAVALKVGAGRTIARIAEMPLGKAFVSAVTLQHDFQLDSAVAAKLLQMFVEGRLLEPEADGSGDCRVTARLREFAEARVVPPLSRTEAKGVVERACALADKINAEATRNPLFIDRLAVSGSYMNLATDRIGKLVLWAVVRARMHVPARPAQSEQQGAHEIRVALRELAPHVFVQVVTDTAPIERPFGVPFEAGNEVPPDPTTTAPLREWAASLRDKLKGT